MDVTFSGVLRIQRKDLKTDAGVPGILLKIVTRENEKHEIWLFGPAGIDVIVEAQEEE